MQSPMDPGEKGNSGQIEGRFDRQAAELLVSTAGAPSDSAVSRGGEVEVLQNSGESRRVDGSRHSE